MPERFSVLPFMIGAVGTANIPGAKVNINRVIEAIIIAAITGTISMWGVTKVLETKMDSLEKKLVQVEQQESFGRKEMRDDIKEVRTFIQQHIDRGK